MKTIHYKQVIAALGVFISISICQGQALNYMLQNNQSGSNRSYAARDSISLRPGFSFSAADGNKFNARIDRALLFPPTANTYATPEGIITTDPAEGGIVGAIPGALDVSPTGGATYSLPIESPEGINGVQPNVALVYNSQSGNGIAGWGWNLSASSTIGRAGTTIYHDGKREEPLLNNNDNLILDGQRLILISGTNLTAGAKYRTEIETYADITMKNINGFLGFEVITKEGATLQYGASADSYIEAQYTSVPLFWALTKTTDTNGNYILYNYSENNPNGEFWLSKIKYTGNEAAGVTPVNEIEFLYDGRIDLEFAFIAGKKVYSMKRLASILSKTNGNIQRKYEFEYTDGFYSKLEKIHLTGTDNAKYNSTSIHWGAQPARPADEVSGPFQGDLNTTPIFADFNDDGLRDFITIRNHAFVSLYLNNGSGGFIKKYEFGFYGDCVDAFVADLDGDGDLDIVSVSIEYTSNGQMYRYNYYMNTGEGFSPGGMLMAGFSTPRPSGDLSYKDYIVGDFNGDEKFEIYIKSTQKLYDERGIAIASQCMSGWITDLNISFNNNQYLTDINGNGKTDICVIDMNQIVVYEFVNNVFALLIWGPVIPADASVFPGDFNGDGKSDLCVIFQNNNNYEYFILTSRGGSFEKSPIYLLNNSLGNTMKFNVGDFNLDGKPDIFAAEYDSQTYQKHPVSKENISQIKYKIGLNQANTFTFINDVSSFYYSASEFINNLDVGDYDGDGRMEAFILYQGDNTPQMSTKSFMDPDNLQISAITNGMNQSISIAYRPITDSLVYINQNGGYSNPSVKQKQFPLYVTASVKSDNLSTSYFYSNAKIHTQGKGFLGFDEVRTTDSINNRISKTSYGFNPTYLNVYPTQQTVTTITGLLPISTTIYTNNVSLSFPEKKIIFPYVSAQKATDHLTGIVATTRVTAFDDVGNPTETTLNQGTILEISRYTYIQKGSWCKNRVSSRRIATNNGAGSTIRETHYQYDSKGNLTREIVDSSHVNKKVACYGNIDLFGHSRAISLQANGKSRVSTLAYTPSGRFVQSKTDHFNQTVNYSWDETKGLLQSQTDRFGTTSYSYNGFGKLQHTIYPDGIRKADALQWAGTGDIPGARYYLHSETSGTAPVITYFDAKGREIARESTELNDRKIRVFTQYDPRNGKLHRVSEPTFGTSPEVWAATRAYDEYGREKTVTSPSGVVSTSYNGLTTTVTSPEGTREITLNTAGQTVTSKENGKSVTFTYYPSGKVKTATPQGGEPITTEYDLQGNQIKLIDPNSGTIEWEYNGFGEPIKEKQKIHNATTDIITAYTIDNNGLTTASNRAGINTYYRYDAKNRINSIEIPGKHRQTFEYDNFDRVTKVTETIEGKEFVTRTEYDDLGRVKKEIYPSDYYTCNTYDKYGNLTAVKDPENRSIAQTLEKNARGQITKLAQGGREARYEFDSRGLPTRIHAGNLFDAFYNFDSKGNLQYRVDNLTNQKEQLEYDNLNRLTTWTIFKNAIIQKQNSLSYDQNSGNITTKSDLGNYIFNYGEENGKPNALTSLSGKPASFPADNLAITYTDFKKVETLAEGNKNYRLTYGVDQERRKSVYTIAGALKQTRYYLGNYEEEIDARGKVRKIHYLPGAILIQNNGVDSLLYSYCDYQGSLVALVNENGTVIEKYAYDPWGNRRDATNWTQKDTRARRVINRGYTGHEHLDAFTVINMNGRVYDPLTAMFMSPDPHVQAPDNWLNYNRYGYCLNNPFRYTDPTGEFWHLIIGAAIGGIGNWAINGAKFNWQGLAYFGIGALAGALGAGIGNGINSALAGGSFGSGFIGSSAAMIAKTSFGTGAAIGAGGGFTTGFTTGLGNGLMSGQKFGKALWSGTKEGFMGGASGALLGGITSGIYAVRDDRNFWHGGEMSTDIDFGIRQGYQVDTYDCERECAEQVEFHYGGNRDHNYFKKIEPGRTGYGLMENEVKNMYDNAGYSSEKIIINRKTPLKTVEKIIESMSKGQPVVLSYDTGARGVTEAGKTIIFGHATVITRIRLYDNGRFIINVMNPARGGWTRFTSLKRILSLISIIK